MEKGFNEVLYDALRKQEQKIECDSSNVLLADRFIRCLISTAVKAEELGVRIKFETEGKLISITFIKGGMHNRIYYERGMLQTIEPEFLIMDLNRVYKNLISEVG